MGSAYFILFLAKPFACVMVYVFGLVDAIAKNQMIVVESAAMLLDDGREASFEVWRMFLPVFCECW